jgi:hypothetical protein
MAESTSPGRELWEKATGAINDFFSFLRDRRILLHSCGAVIWDQPSRLKNKSFQFASSSIVVPTLLVGLLVGVLKINDPPPTQLDRAIANDKKAEDVFANVLSAMHKTPPASGKYYPVAAMSDLELQTESQRLRDLLTMLRSKQTLSLREQERFGETKQRLLELTGELLRRSEAVAVDAAKWGKDNFFQERVFLQAIAKFSALTESCLFIITGASLVMSAYMFRFLLSKKLFPRAREADTAYLYIIGALLFFPHMAAAAANAMFDFASRYDWKLYFDLYDYIIALIAIWGLLALRSAAKMLASVLGDPVRKDTRLVIKIANRLLIAQAFSFGLIEVALLLFGLPIFYLILKAQR